ncbi:SPASM domain-containing protein [Azospirillum sp. YIM B02556]|uniref:SPASM domain-containing protein n=1 Tax=Azospirillum endophyticum TaxID=2800326 RepID=A0ABS1F7N3_9PROT|nr:SPASM domain-containing protein [Azospirillum endophyticum]MBK1839398.1 SPASM domain-containing protein [Azospirillum endophyticum]
MGVIGNILSAVRRSRLFLEPAATLPEQRPAGEIVGGRKVVQVFRPAADHLSSISPLLATYAGVRDCRLILSLYALPPGGETEVAMGDLPAAWLVGRMDLDGTLIIDNAFQDFRLITIPQAAGRSFALVLESPDAAMGNALTVWLHSGARRLAGHVACFVNGEHQGGYGLMAELGHSPPSADGPVPPGLLLSPVTQCNLNCVHCISRETRASVARLDDKLRDSIREWSRRGWLRAVDTDYSGDILWADHRFGGELDFIIGLNVPFHVNTNGIHLSQDACERLLASRLQSLNVSLDAATDVTYRRIRRGAPPLDEVLINLRRLSDARGSRRQPALLLGFTLMRSNLDELLSFIRLAAGLGFDVVQCRHLEAYTADMEAESLWFDQARYAEIWGMAVALAAELGIKLEIQGPFDAVPARAGRGACPEPWRSAVVLGNGDVMACCIPGTRMGNLRETSMEELWNGPAYQAFRLAVNSAEPPAACRTCPIYRDPRDADSYLQHRARRKSDASGATH